MPDSRANLSAARLPPPPVGILSSWLFSHELFIWQVASRFRLFASYVQVPRCSPQLANFD
jgi:hypothetical protein